MKNNLLIAASAVLLMFTACQKEDFSMSGDSSDAIRIFSTITPYEEINDTPDTRANLNSKGDGKVIFNNGDQMTLYITDGAETTTHNLTYQNGWTGLNLKWGDLKSAQISFSAIYPAVGNDAPFLHKIEGQKFNNKIETVDKYLHASATITRGEPVSLDFRHIMNMIEINLLPGAGLTSNDLINKGVSVMGASEVYIDPKTGEASNPSGVKEIYADGTQLTKYRVAMAPQDILSSWRNEAWIKIYNVASSPLIYKAPAKLNNGSALNSLESGKKLTINIYLSKSGDVSIDTDLTDRLRWCYGINVSAIPPVSTWGYSTGTVLGLSWNPSMGWYDVKKRDAVGAGYDDHRLCWAASTSNLLHWWMDRVENDINPATNKPYGYLTRAGYDGPRLYDDPALAERFGANPNNHHVNSAIFQFYKDHFTDIGGFTSQGLKWFFTGEYLGMSGGEETHENVDHTGFMKDIFIDAVNDKDFIYSTGMYGNSLTPEVLKKAVDGEYAIGFDVLAHQGKGGHAMVIWGVAFDEDNKTPTWVMLVDNNDTDGPVQSTKPMQPGKLCGYGIVPKKLAQKGGKNTHPECEFPDWGADGHWFMESGSQDKLYSEVYIVTLFGTGRQYFEKYFAEHPEL